MSVKGDNLGFGLASGAVEERHSPAGAQSEHLDAVMTLHTLQPQQGAPPSIRRDVEPASARAAVRRFSAGPRHCWKKRFARSMNL